MTGTDLWACFFALRSIKRHLKDGNYGLAIAEIDQLGMILDVELRPADGLEWE